MTQRYIVTHFFANNILSFMHLTQLCLIFFIRLCCHRLRSFTVMDDPLTNYHLSMHGEFFLIVAKYIAVDFTAMCKDLSRKPGISNVSTLTKPSANTPQMKEYTQQIFIKMIKKKVISHQVLYLLKNGIIPYMIVNQK